MFSRLGSQTLYQDWRQRLAASAAGQRNGRRRALEIAQVGAHGHAVQHVERALLGRR